MFQSIATFRTKYVNSRGSQRVNTMHAKKSFETITPRLKEGNTDERERERASNTQRLGTRALDATRSVLNKIKL